MGNRIDVTCSTNLQLRLPRAEKVVDTFGLEITHAGSCAAGSHEHLPRPGRANVVHAALLKHKSAIGAARAVLISLVGLRHHQEDRVSLSTLGGVDRAQDWTVPSEVGGAELNRHTGTGNEFLKMNQINRPRPTARGKAVKKIPRCVA